MCNLDGKFFISNPVAYIVVDFNSFSDKLLAFLWEQTVPHYWLTCFSIAMKMSFYINSFRKAKRKLARKFNLSYHYIDDLISFNNKRFKEFISDIYLKELTILKNHRVYFSCFLSRSAFHPR